VNRTMTKLGGYTIGYKYRTWHSFMDTTYLLAIAFIAASVLAVIVLIATMPIWA